jgi:hypothetical protein
MERVQDVINEARASHRDQSKKISDSHIAILKELKDQVSETGIVLVKTPLATYTLTNRGVKEVTIEGRSLNDDSYSTVLRVLEKLYGNYGNPFDNEFKAAENVSAALANIAKTHKLKITGKYLSK